MFLFHQVVISEIMADPSPVVGLPSAEYIELFNRSESVFSMAGCRLKAGKYQKPLPAVNIPAKGYLILCDVSDTTRLSCFGKVAGIPGMPAVINTGCPLTLFSPEGKVIHTVTYSDHWYCQASKSGGGWSLEMIDAANPCGRSENWCASEDPSGGTPGRPNSVSAANPDLVTPLLLRATTDDGLCITLHFSENMDSASLSDPGAYYGSRGLLNPVSVHPVGPDYAAVNLTFRSPLSKEFIYTLTALPQLTDCVGNPLAAGPGADVAIPWPADSFDVVLNEVLADVADGKSEFIEVLNRSDKVADLSEFTLTLTSCATGSTREVNPGDPFLLFPGQPVVLTRDGKHLPDSIQKPDPARILELPSLFILPDEEGILALESREGRVTDRLIYSQSMHSPFLSDTEGVSLERLDSDLPTQDGDNWASASSLEGYATPGRQNSQHVNENEAEEIIVSPAVFSPDGDGVDETILIGIHTDEPGCLGEVRIFDLRGTCVAVPAHHELMPRETWLTWDGTRMDKSILEPGIYVIYTEFTCRTGIVRKSRKVVTLMRKI